MSLWRGRRTSHYICTRFKVWQSYIPLHTIEIHSAFVFDSFIGQKNVFPLITVWKRVVCSRRVTHASCRAANVEFDTLFLVGTEFINNFSHSRALNRSHSIQYIFFFYQLWLHNQDDDVDNHYYYLSAFNASNVHSSNRIYIYLWFMCWTNKIMRIIVSSTTNKRWTAYITNASIFISAKIITNRKEWPSTCIRQMSHQTICHDMICCYGWTTAWMLNSIKLKSFVQVMKTLHLHS